MTFRLWCCSDILAGRLAYSNENRGLKIKKCQGDHGGCRANCRCCIPALAGFVSPHSMGPGTGNLPHPARTFKQNSSPSCASRLCRIPQSQKNSHITQTREINHLRRPKAIYQGQARNGGFFALAFARLPASEGLVTLCCPPSARVTLPPRNK
jgi:hypothetical protein